MAIPADRNVTPDEAEKKRKDTTNVEHEMCDRSHRNSKTRFTEAFGSRNRKMFRRFTTKGSYIWNITHKTESTAV